MATDTQRPAYQQLFKPLGIVSSCVAMFMIGSLEALYGPSIPMLKERFELSSSAAGLALTAHFSGGMCGIIVFQAAHSRMGNRLLLGTSQLLMAVGSAVFGFAPSWSIALVAAFTSGLGFGGLDYGVNQLFSVGFCRRGNAYINLVNAFFGLGAVTSPLFIGIGGEEHLSTAFASLSLLTALLPATLSGIRNRPTTLRRRQPAQARPPVPYRNAGLLLTFTALYALHIAVGSGVGGWEATHLEAVGYSPLEAASATSAFWLMMTVGRFLIIPFSVRQAPARVITVCCAGMTVCLVLAVSTPVAPYAYGAVGLFIAPIFANGLTWLHQVVPEAERATAFVLAVSMVGEILLPPLLGRGVESLGVTWLPLALSAMSLMCLFVTLRIRRASVSPAESPL